MANNKKAAGYILCAVVVVALIWFALSYPAALANKSAQDASRRIGELQNEAERAARDFRREIKTHQTTTRKKAGEIRASKEVEIRALGGDDLVQRHLDALARFSGERDDRESARGLDGK